MKLPNIVSLAILAGVTIALQVLAAGADQLVPAVWAPVLVAVIAAVLKAIQVIAETRETDTMILSVEQRKKLSPFRRTLLD